MRKVKKSGEVTDVRRKPPTADGQRVRSAVPAGEAPPAQVKRKRPAAIRTTERRAAAPAKGRKAAEPRKPARRAKPASPRSATTTPARSGRVAKRGRPAKPAPEVQLRIRDLNPQQKCGAGTSVVRLIRVDEIIERALRAHLVFLDKHGWYCEHGRTCSAVGHAQRHARRVAPPQ